MGDVVDQSEPKRGGKCPICRKPAQPDSRPFCSRRCADVDLARWLGGGYAIAGSSDDSGEDEDDALARRIPVNGHEGSKDENE